jgi:hypothetical protein
MATENTLAWNIPEDFNWFVDSHRGECLIEKIVLR